MQSSTCRSADIPRVSVLIPVFNTASFLLEALTSIRVQTFTDFELISVDDGSSDGSTAILRQFAAEEVRMKLVTRENLGLISTRNELLAMARGELIAWMDSDDVSFPQRLALQVEAFERDPDLMCLGTAAQCIDPDGNLLNIERYPTLHQDILLEQLNGGAMRFPTTMMRRDRAKSVGGFREPFRIGEDLDFLLRLSEIGKMANLPDALYFYRQHIASVCVSLGSQWPVYRDQILELARERRNKGSDRLQKGGQLNIPRPSNNEWRRNEWQVYLKWARHALENKNGRLSWKYACTAIVRRPLSRAAWKMIIRVVWQAGRDVLK